MITYEEIVSACTVIDIDKISIDDCLKRDENETYKQLNTYFSLSLRHILNEHIPVQIEIGNETLSCEIEVIRAHEQGKGEYNGQGIFLQDICIPLGRTTEDKKRKKKRSFTIYQTYNNIGKIILENTRTPTYEQILLLLRKANDIGSSWDTQDELTTLLLNN